MKEHQPTGTGESPRSAHGGALPIGDRVLRANLREQLFGHAVPTKVGRFVVERSIGVGGMGAVFAARDEELDRLVAVKVVRDAATRDAAKMRARMLKEARSLAKLAHPNVVAIYEVGVFEDGVFIAMEFVRGTSLRQWLAASPRTVQDVLSVFRAAGAGLAAAHRRGITHRDFKPDNVLIDEEEQRPRVADFGLASIGVAIAHHDADARATDALLDDAVGSPPTAGSANLSTSHGGDLSTRGSVAGTPAYMAPEQALGRVVDEASDQYAFCVSLHEGLFGHRPDAPTGPAAATGRVSRRVLRAIERGLAESPSERWPSMDALLAELEPRSRWRWWWVAGVACVGAAGAAWPAASQLATCTPPPAKEWDAARSAVKATFTNADRAYIVATWPMAAESIDGFVERWQQQSVAACRLASSRSTEEQAGAAACLEDGVRELVWLVREFSKGGPLMSKAVTSISALPAPERCNTSAALADGAPVADPNAQRFVEHARGSLHDAKLTLATLELGLPPDVSVSFAGAIERGAAAAINAKEQALAARSPALASEAGYVLGQLRLLEGDIATAERVLGEAAATAEQAGHSPARIRALSLKAYVVGQNRERLGEAEQIAAVALAALDAEDDPALRAHVLNNLANVRARARPPDFKRAIETHQEALTLLEEALGPGHPDSIRARLSLGATLNRSGASEAGLGYLREGVRSSAEVWGRGHPTYARAARLLGLALLKAGELDEAAPHLRHALSVHDEVLGSIHREVANDLYNNALLERRIGHHAEALVLLRRGIAIHEDLGGPNHPQLIPWLLLLGRSALALGRHDDARTSLERALALCELDGADASDFAKIRLLLARALAVQDPQRARVLAIAARNFYAGHGNTKLRDEADALLRTIAE